MRHQGTNAAGEPYELFIPKTPEALATGIDASRDGRTRQEFAEECDINKLMETYEQTGVLNHYNSTAPQYLDVSDIPDLQLALDTVARAGEAFMTLPARVRAEFDNDPVKFVSYAEDPKNLSQMREWGLAPPAPPEAASVSSSSTPTAAAPAPAAAPAAAQASPGGAKAQ